MNPPASNGLGEDQDVDCKTDSMVGIGQSPIRSHGDESKDKDDSDQGQCEDLEPDVKPEGPEGPSTVETRNHDCRGNEDKECDDGKNAMTEDEGMVFWQTRETVTHTCKMDNQRNRREC